ncbi:MFS transporter [Sporosarcina limicola]|uniref:DHA3 family tetracycline resistance protein-like MFS transporter n=1 Tax=Sporosarcina limicola TaxID=34101 RepID=A0A927RGI5_9BACL|nr:MFS transporter [Sporosarcina limicola]MBE1556547.1 DHA3 family tetracycline resistance protein-like MFS transporter [Sporosarcina limicola]
MNRLKSQDPYRVYIYTCFLSQLFFTFIFTVNLLYHVKIVMLEPLQLVLVGTVLELSVFLFEIPTGVVSDVKSRKLSIIIGYFLIGIGFLVEGLFPYFVTVLLAQIIWGIGYTFTSGSRQAWIADEIGEERASSAFIKGAKAGNLGQVIAIPLSILTGYFMINLPIIIGGVCMIGLAAYLVFFMKEENFKPLDKVGKISIWVNMKGNMGKIIFYSKASFIMRMLFLIALFVGFYSEGFDRLWMSHFLVVSNLSALTDEELVVVMGGIQFVVVLVSFTALHFMNRSSIYQNLRPIYVALFIGSVCIIIGLIGFALSTYVIALLVFYVMIQVTRQVMYPLEDIWLNKIIPDSSTRATFFSVKGQVDAIGQIGGGPVIGIIASNFAIKTAIIVSALLVAPVLFLYKTILNKSRG